MKKHIEEKKTEAQEIDNTDERMRQYIMSLIAESPEPTVASTASASSKENPKRVTLQSILRKAKK